MALIVQKYGGSSLATPNHLRRIAKRIVHEAQAENQIVVVVSAMGDTTDHLVQLSKEICQNPPERELDMLLSVGERISIALLAMAIHELGREAISFTGSQVGIITDNRHTEARILEVRATRMLDALKEGKIVIVAGFQGVSVNKEITTLGRGGSDITAIALAAALKADRCEIMKDVDGIYVAEPKVVPMVHLNKKISYDEMIEMTNFGAGVLKKESLEIAKDHKIEIAIGSSFTGKIGTIISDFSLESSNISGIVGKKDLFLATVKVMEPSEFHDLNQYLLRNSIKALTYFMYSQQIVILFQNKFKNSFMKWLSGLKKFKNKNEISFQDNVGFIAIIGTGLNTDTLISKRIFNFISTLDLEFQYFQASGQNISFVAPSTIIDDLIRKLHDNLVAN